MHGASIDLPNDLWYLILKLLPSNQDIMAFGLTQRKFYHLTRDKHFLFFPVGTNFKEEKISISSSVPGEILKTAFSHEKKWVAFFIREPNDSYQLSMYDIRGNLLLKFYFPCTECFYLAFTPNSNKLIFCANPNEGSFYILNIYPDRLKENIPWEYQIDIDHFKINQILVIRNICQTNQYLFLNCLYHNDNDGIDETLLRIDLNNHEHKFLRYLSHSQEIVCITPDQEQIVSVCLLQKTFYVSNLKGVSIDAGSHEVQEMNPYDSEAELLKNNKSIITDTNPSLRLFHLGCVNRNVKLDHSKKTQLSFFKVSHDEHYAAFLYPEKGRVKINLWQFKKEKYITTIHYPVKNGVIDFFINPYDHTLIIVSENEFETHCFAPFIPDFTQYKTETPSSSICLTM